MKLTHLRRVVLLMAVMIFAASAAFAMDVMFTWNLPTAPADVEYYRYQVDGEAEDNWTVIDADTESVEVGPFPIDEPHMFYLQQSFDGELWSESAVGEYLP